MDHGVVSYQCLLRSFQFFNVRLSHIIKKYQLLLIYKWEKKQGRQANKWMNNVKRRCGNKEVDCTTSNGSGVGQKQMETSSSSLSIIEINY